MNSQQQHKQFAGLSLATSKHVTHDDYWLLPGISSAYFCFACAVESLDNKTTLDIHRKKILAEMLEVFLSNCNIWKVLCSKRDVFIHILTLFVKLLSQCKDDDFASVIIECCTLTVKHTNIEQASTIVTECITGISNFANNSYLLQLFNKIIELAPAAVQLLYVNQARFISDIVKAACASNKSNCLIPIWKLIKQTVKSSESVLPRTLYKEILLSANQVMKDTSIIRVQIEVLESVKCFTELKHLKTILFDHENSKLTTSVQSTFEGLKKFILCSNEEVQCLAIRCVSSLADTSKTENQTHTTLLDIVLEKGICEFLLEILPSANEQVTSLLFQCLHKLTYSKMFCKMGHMVYVFAATIKAVLNALHFQDTSSFYHGLSLLMIMLQKGMNDRCTSQSSEQSVEILKILCEGFQKPHPKIKFLTVSCFNAFLQHNTSISSLYALIDDFIEGVFNYIEKEIVLANSSIDSYTEELICSSYEAMLSITTKISEKLNDTRLLERELNPNSSDASQLREELQLLKLTENIYDLCDRYCIPQAVLNFLPAKNSRFQCVFFKMVLAVIELVPSKGEKISLKLAESAFFRLIHEFKVVSSRTSQNMDEVLAKLLYYLCLSAEPGALSGSLKDQLYSSFSNFNIPMNDWKWLLNQHAPSSMTIDKDFINKSRICVLALLTYSHKAGHCMIPLQAVIQELQKFAFSESALLSLPILGKRYFLYLWCHGRMDLSNFITDLAHSNVVSMFHSDADSLSEMIMLSDIFMVWALNANLPLKIQRALYEEYFASCDDNNVDRYSMLLSRLQSEDQNIKFVEVCLHVAGTCENQAVLNEIFYVGKSIIQSLEPSSYDHFKDVIRKIFLTGENKVIGNNSATLIKFLNEIAIISPLIVNHDDLKLLCRILVLATEIQTPTMQFEVFNYIYIIATKSMKSQNAKLISIIMEKVDLFTQFEKSLFVNKNVINNSNSSQMLERINAAVILLISELMFSSKLFAISHSTVLRFRKDIFIEILVSSSLPLMQTSVLLFWSRYFQLKCSSPVIQFINEKDENCSIIPHDVKLLIIALQNLYYNQELLIRENAVSCLVSLINNLQNVNIFLHQPWNHTLQKAAIERLTYDGMDVPTLQLLTLFVKHSVCLDKKLFSSLMNLLKCFSTEVNDVDVVTKFVLLFDTIVTFHVSDVKYLQLKEIKEGMKKLDTEFSKCKLDCEHSKTAYVSLNGMMLLRDIVVLDVNIFTQMKKIKLAVEKRMEIIDGDSTDSGDETEE